MSENYSIGSIVKVRNREWIVIPSPNKDVLMLKPLGGSEKEISGIYLPLNLEKIEPAAFPKPDINKTSDLTSIKLLRDASRLSFRSGAGPFRSLGKLSVRPRPYQFVPLLMGLKQETIRLLIADDVGIGKTVEALMIARELYDRGEIKSLGVVCPPHLCDQWQKELLNKFNFNAVVIRSNTVSQLERAYTDNNISIFKHYNIFVTSIDYIKSDRRRETFLLNLPDLIIVDEAHTCAKPISDDKSQQQRYELVKDIANNEKINLILLTATPHSGKEDVFLSLIGHLDEKFSRYEIDNLSDNQRSELAKYFIQRKRGDVKKWVGVDTPFPNRIPIEESYTLSKEYSDLFNDVYKFLLALLSGDNDISHHKKRVRYWAALGMLRSIMSSPEAGLASLRNKMKKIEDAITINDDSIDSFYNDFVIDLSEKELTNDIEPSNVVQDAEEDFSDYQRKKLSEFARKIEELKGKKDYKLKHLVKVIKEIIAEGYNPIIFCRFIATSDYVADQLREYFSDYQILSVTSELAEEEREEKINWLGEHKKRILVATDCLSEGVNLQHCFNCVIHYDLPWNPNRLEQREGRVDRFGQKGRTLKDGSNILDVKTVILYGADNPIDGAVLDVLIRKAVRIHKTLGIAVPLPMNSETVIQSVINSVFMKNGNRDQLTIDFGPEFRVNDFHREWDKIADREKVSRTKFAQHSIKPEEVSKELEETDAVLGNPNTVREFIISSVERLGGSINKKGVGISLNPNGFSQLLREKIKIDAPVDLAFDFPIPENHIEVGRNHNITTSLAEYILEISFENENPEGIYRSCCLRTELVDKVTTVYLLRVRFLIETLKKDNTILAEEMLMFGYSGSLENPKILGDKEALECIVNISASNIIEKDYSVELLDKALKDFNGLDVHLKKILEKRKEILLTAHTRLRKITKEMKIDVIPQLPADVLGVVVLVPVPKGVNS